MSDAVAPGERRIYLVFAFVLALIVFVGFAPSFYLKNVIHAPPPLSVLTVTHGVIYTAWMVLFIAQVWLIDAGKPAIHRQLGILGVLLFGALMVQGYSTAITAGQLGHAPPGAPEPLAFMALPLIGLTGTGVLVVLGLLNRRRSDWHVRAMLAATITFTAPAAHRVAIPLGFAAQGTNIAFLVMDVLLAIAIILDQKGRKRIHPAYAWAIGVYVTIEGLVIWAYSSPTWLAFAHWLTQS